MRVRSSTGVGAFLRPWLALGPQQLSAWARASSVTSAPDSMRATSSRRLSSESGCTRVTMRFASRPPPPSWRSDVLAGARGDLRRVGDGQHLQLPASRASLAPMASATAPPTPVSISSKISVGAEPLAARITFSASMNRASSPPEATFTSGDSGVPGLAETTNSTRSMPWGRAFRRRCRSGFEARLLELQRRSSAITALSSAFAALRRLLESLSAAASRPRARPQACSSSRAGRRHRSAPAAPPRSARARGRCPPCTCTCAPRRAAQTAAPRISPVPAGRRRRRAAPPRGALGFASSASTRSSAGTLVEPAARLLAPALEPAQRRVDAGGRGAVAGERLLGLASAPRQIARTFIISWRASASFASSPAWGSARAALPRRVRDSRARPRPAPSAAVLGERRLGG